MDLKKRSLSLRPTLNNMTKIDELLKQHADELLAAGWDLREWQPFLDSTRRLIESTVVECVESVDSLRFDSGDIDDRALGRVREEILQKFGIED